MYTFTATDQGSHVSPRLNEFLQKQRLRAVVSESPGCDTVMLVDYVFIEDELILLVLLEEHGHRAHLFMQHKPGAWTFRPVFRYKLGKPIHNSFGPHAVEITCPKLQEFFPVTPSTERL